MRGEPSNWKLPGPGDKPSDKDKGSDDEEEEEGQEAPDSSQAATSSRKRHKSMNTGEGGGDGGGDPSAAPFRFDSSSPGPRCTEVMFYLASQEDIEAWRAEHPNEQPLPLDVVSFQIRTCSVVCIGLTRNHIRDMSVCSHRNKTSS